MKLKTILIIIAVLAGMAAVWYLLIRKREEAPEAIPMSRAETIRINAPIRAIREEVRTAAPRTVDAAGGVRKIR